MTPHAALALMTQEEASELLCACVQYLTVDKIEAALREGLEPQERRQLAYQLSIEFDLDSPQESESS